jgi:hypothetical protein
VGRRQTDVNRELEGEEKSFSEKKAEGDSSTQRRNQGWKELPSSIMAIDISDGAGKSIKSLTLEYHSPHANDQSYWRIGRGRKKFQ